MDKDVTMNPKKGNKQPKIRKKQPLKVVYITNPIKFKTSASEFRSLVQELTGQDSDLPESSTKFSAERCAGGYGGSQPGDAEAAKMALEADRNTVHALEDAREIGQHNVTINGDVSQGSDPASFWSFGGGVPQGPDLSSFGSFGYNEIYSPLMVEELQGLVDSSSSQEASHFDVFKRLESM
ncbi:uncharacterized protein [Primulina huaijiensis]|uniref:uncharacterized protein n=1 Tax=Primulina huaijiensis TaxID=1492673 RepID=UPI003CC73A9B